MAFKGGDFLVVNGFEVLIGREEFKDVGTLVGDGQPIEVFICDEVGGMEKLIVFVVSIAGAAFDRGFSV